MSINVQYSHRHHRLELPPSRIPALRLGMRLIKGLTEESADRIVSLRKYQPFANLEDFHRRALISPEQRAALASTNSFHTLAENRYQNTWQALSHQLENLPACTHLPENSLEDNTYSDYASTGLILREHPIALLRKRHNYPTC